MPEKPSRWALLLVVLFAGVVPWLLSRAALEVLGSRQTVNEPLHASLEVAGACIALSVCGLLLLKVEHEQNAVHLLWITAGLTAMGILDGVHSILVFGTPGSWLRHGATLLGGLFYGLIWVPFLPLINRRKTASILALSFLILGTSLYLSLHPSLLARPWINGDTFEYTLGARIMNLVGGAGFLSATVFFMQRYLRQGGPENIAFASQSLLLAAAAVLTSFSRAWGGDWWMWHFARLLAYGLALVAGYEMVVALYRNIAADAAELEQRVKNRTAEVSNMAMFVNENPFPVVRAGRDGTLLYANPSADGLIAKWQCAPGGQLPPSVRSVVERTLQQGSMETVETNLGERIFSLVAIPIRDRNYVNFYGRDITDTKQAQHRLESSEARLVQAVRVGGLGTFEHNHLNDTIEFSPLLREMWHFSPDEEITMDALFGRVHPDDREGFKIEVQKAHDPRGNGMFSVEYRVPSPDGRVRWISVRSQTFFEGEGEGRHALRTIGAVLDITDRKESEARLEKLVAQRTSKLQEVVAELEHFSYTITHDMRAPLRAMQGFAEILLDTCANCKERDCSAFLQRIRTSAERMDSLIRDALNYSKAIRQELPVEPVDLAALLQGMLDSYPEFQPVRATIECDANIPSVMGNQAALTQCFSNLIGNAVKFVRPGERPQVRIWAEPRGEWVRVWVEDKGIGISQTMMPHLFKMFARGDQNYEGTGIGLALVRKVVERMGGRSGVESEEGVGSRFWVELHRGE